ncbi:reductive dehalogenase [Dehalogenimonas sp. WBC-2]|nr:reductive dehalogenase [Dehalogenimonas sp. WBC-2]
MSNHHSTMSRRDFMKGLGLVSAGIGAATATSPLFHDVDEITSSASGERKRPWWVKEVDEITVETDWNAMKRFNARDIMQCSLADRIGRNKLDDLIKLSMNNRKQWILENKPGYTLRDFALFTGANFGWFDGFSKCFTGDKRTSPMSGLGGSDSDVFYLNFGIDGTEQRPGSPDALCVPLPGFPVGGLAVPRWEGTPEENLRTVRAASRFYGCDEIGVGELDSLKGQKMIWTQDWDGKHIVFEDVDHGYETGPFWGGVVQDKEKRVIPTKARWYISLSQLMSDWNIKRAPTLFGDFTTAENYSRLHYAQIRLQRFIKALGYEALAGFMFINTTSNNPGMATLNGLGEHGRIGQLVSPEFGALQRLAGIITDMPLTPSKPIDAGIWRFCSSCSKCQENCPPQALSASDPVTYDVKGTWNNPGKKSTWLDGVKCASFWYEATTLCGVCVASCPWSRQDKSWVHDLIVKPSIASTTIFNSFFRSMDDAYGYARAKYDYKTQVCVTERDPEEWWDLQDLPVYGIYKTH